MWVTRHPTARVNNFHKRVGKRREGCPINPPGRFWLLGPLPPGGRTPASFTGVSLWLSLVMAVVVLAVDVTRGSSRLCARVFQDRLALTFSASAREPHCACRCREQTRPCPSIRVELMGLSVLRRPLATNRAKSTASEDPLCYGLNVCVPQSLLETSPPRDGVRRRGLQEVTGW